MPQNFAGTMQEWGAGRLHSGRKGKVVKKGKKGQKQALAIAFAQDRRMKNTTLGGMYGK